jgi:NitT/TauT family transport system substrate-binding protein
MKKSNLKKAGAAVLLIMALLLTACAKEGGDKDAAGDNTKTADEKPTVKIGAIKALGTITPYIAQQKGFFEEAGISVEIVDFADGSALGEAFAASGLDIALMGVAPTATWQSKGVDLKIVASANGGGHVILTREDTGINSIEDLKGHIIAEPNPGTVTDTLLRDYILPNAGLDPEEDVQILSGLKPADMAASLAVTGEVDAIITWEPFSTQALQQYEGLKLLYDSAQVIKDATGAEALYPVNVVSASGSLISENPDLLQSFMDAYKKTIDFINTDPGANAEIAKALELEEDVIAKSRERVDFTYKIDAKGLLETLKWANDLGYLEKLPTQEELFDFDFAGE